MMRWVSRHILLAPFMMVFLLFGCRSQMIPVVTTSKETTVTVTERDVPVFTPQIDISARGKVFVSPDGIPKLGVIKVTSNSDKPDNEKPKVSATIDEQGNLNIDVTIPPDTTRVTVSDSTKQTRIENTKYVEVEKKLSWWQQTLIYAGALFILIGFVRFVTVIKK